MDWSFVPALIAGAGIAEVASLWRERRSRGDETDRWRRDRRIDAYADITSAQVEVPLAIDRMLNAMREELGTGPPLARRLQDESLGVFDTDA